MSDGYGPGSIEYETGFSHMVTMTLGPGIMFLWYAMSHNILEFVWIAAFFFLLAGFWFEVRRQDIKRARSEASAACIAHNRTWVRERMLEAARRRYPKVYDQML